ncbi:MAG: GNAT family N-acetyltransferase [Acidobacteria bacterium]|nr:GNAT family N-acetyltransferase [Acidobacteriota bacterium]
MGKMMSELTFASARPIDLPGVRSLLSDAGLPSEDIEPHIGHFILAKNGAGLVGCVGLEPAGALGLLRSLAVASGFRGGGLGHELCDRLTRQARNLGVKELYLLTTSAEGFFAKRGFARIERRDAPDAIRATEEFRTCCPSTAVCMKLDISGAQYP